MFIFELLKYDSVYKRLDRLYISIYISAMNLALVKEAGFLSNAFINKINIKITY